MKIEIDPGAGPCFGVERAIKIAENTMLENKQLFCIGDLIHNEQEIKRLEKLGMKTIHLKDAIAKQIPEVLFRAHGEAPSSFQIAKENNIKIIDATCPIVINLQNQIRKTYQKIKQTEGQIIIFGNRKHPEIISLLGFCEENAIIIDKLKGLDSLDFLKPIYLFSQTTKYQSDYYLIKEEIENRIQLLKKSSSHLFFHDSTCRLVAKRDKQLKEFIKDKDIIIFVSGKKSSNGKQLFQICKQSGIPSFFISKGEELKLEWFLGKVSLGISGATSTPYWLLDDVKDRINNSL